MQRNFTLDLVSNFVDEAIMKYSEMYCRTEQIHCWNSRFSLQKTRDTNIECEQERENLVVLEWN